MTDFALVERGNLAIGISAWPDRDRPSVVVRRGTVLHTVATCRDVLEAQRLMVALQEISRTEEQPETVATTTTGTH